MTIMRRYYCLCGWSVDTSRHALRMRIVMHNLKHIVLGRI